MTKCEGCTVTAAIPGCRLLAPGGKAEVVVSVCMDCPETGRGPSEVSMRPAVSAEDGGGVSHHCLRSLS